MVRFRFSKGLNREPDPKNVKLHIHSGSSSRALNAILPLVASGQPYEAHQKTRTFTSRYSKSGQYDTAIDVLFQSARELLKVSQHCPAGDQVQPLPHLIPSLLKAPAPPNQMSGLALSSERVAGAGENGVSSSTTNDSSYEKITSLPSLALRSAQLLSSPLHPPYLTP
ncbi:hypothetical protein EV424DRAFT_1646259 [Suillus variegatus]|nr:hypothetical protein EV424DRAFT_1646259 [Suillus variegatus]